MEGPPLVFSARKVGEDFCGVACPTSIVGIYMCLTDTKYKPIPPICQHGFNRGVFQFGGKQRLSPQHVPDNQAVDNLLYRGFVVGKNGGVFLRLVFPNAGAQGAIGHYPQ